MTTEVELCKQMIGDGIAHHCSWNHCESRGDPGASRIDIFERKVLKVCHNFFNFNLQRFSYRVVNGIGWFSHGSL